MGKNIFVYVEQRDGTLQRVGLELIGEAKRLAQSLDAQVVGVLMGSDVEPLGQTLIQHGADEVLVVDEPLLKEYTTEPYTKALTQIIKNYEPEIFLFGATSQGRDLAPRVAGRVHTGLTADCTGLEIDEESKLLLMTRPAFGGNLMATIVCKDYRPQMATVRPGIMVALPKDPARTGSVTRVPVAFSPEDQNVKIVEMHKETRKIVDITEAKILVSGGRGIGGPEGFQLLRRVADELGGEISSSRVCVENGWIESERQVGQTGKTVRPNLYLACGISGQIQHLAGMEESDLIIAINKNETAPIFGVADLGIVGDLNVILPKLVDALKAYKAQKANEVG